MLVYLCLCWHMLKCIFKLIDFFFCTNTQVTFREHPGPILRTAKLRLSASSVIHSISLSFQLFSPACCCSFQANTGARCVAIRHSSASHYWRPNAVTPRRPRLSVPWPLCRWQTQVLWITGKPNSTGKYQASVCVGALLIWTI